MYVRLAASPRAGELARLRLCVSGSAPLPDAEWGETVAAWVVPAGDGLDAEALAAFAGERLAGYKRPRTVTIVAELPRNALGKVLRHELPAPT